MKFLKLYKGRNFRGPWPVHVKDLRRVSDRNRAARSRNCPSRVQRPNYCTAEHG